MPTDRDSKSHLGQPNQRWQRTWEIFHEAVDLAPGDRPAFLDRACAGDPELRRSLDLLLDGHARRATLFERAPEAEPQEASDLLGQRIDHYELEAILGQGGMGVVYSARQTEPIERMVALKLIRPGLATREVLRRFELERQTLAALDHPNIARVYDAGSTDDGRPYFVMERVQGLDVIRYCDQHRLDMQARLRLFAGICRGIHHAHQRGVLHRDLKPSNILVAAAGNGEEPVPKVIDFGVARAMYPLANDLTAVTRIGQFLGTPEYMAPEQADSLSNADVRSDIYSLGVVLYEMLAGCLPHDQESLRRRAVEQVRKILREDAVSLPSARVSLLGEAAQAVARSRHTRPEALARALRGDLDWIVMRALEKDPDRRYDSASDFALDLERHLRDEPVEAGPPSLSYRCRKFARRHRWGVTLATVIALSILISLGIWTLRSLEVRRALATAEREAHRADQVATFLTDLFEQSDPRTALGNEVRAREILDRGAARIREAPELDPALRVELLTLLGEVYASLGLFDDAEALLLQARREAEAGFEATNPLVARAQLTLGQLRELQGRYEEAHELLTLLIATLREDSPRSPLLGETLNTLGSVERRLGNYENSVAALEEALALHREAAGSDSLEVARSHSYLARALRAQGNHQAAAELLERSITVGVRELGEDHPDVATWREALAGIHRDRGRYEPAAALHRTVLATRERVYGEDHPSVATSLSNLALTLGEGGHTDEVEALFLRALEVERSSRGDDHPSAVLALSNLGAFYRRSGRLQEAEQVLREAERRGRVAWPPLHPELGTVLNNLAVVLERQERLEVVEDLYLEVLQIRRATVGERHALVATTLSNLGVLYRKLGRLEEAESMYSQALEIERETLGPEHPNLGLRLLNLATLRRHQERFAEGAEFARRAHSNQLAVFGEKHARTNRALAYLGRMQWLAGEHVEGKDSLARAVAVYQQLLAELDEEARDRAVALRSAHDATGAWLEEARTSQ